MRPTLADVIHWSWVDVINGLHEPQLASPLCLCAINESHPSIVQLAPTIDHRIDLSGMSAESHQLELILGRVSQYTGRQAINRLRFLAQTCPPLSLSALQLALEAIVRCTWDIPLYKETITYYNNVADSNDLPLISEDLDWLDSTQVEIANNFARLENDLQYNATNLIKDGIRTSHLELAAYYRKVGELSNAHKAFSKARECAVTPWHIAEVSLASLDLAFDAENFKLAQSQVAKAQAALETLMGSIEIKASKSKSSGNIPQKAAPFDSSDDQEPGEHDIKRWTERMDIVNGLTTLTQGYFAKATASFLKVGREFDDNSGMQLLATASDIAIYTTLCALATLDREELKEKIIDNLQFRSILESEPQLRTILNFVRQNQFRQVFEFLEGSYLIYKTDLYLADQIEPLMQMIQERAIVQYFSPFRSARLTKASEVFGWSIDQLQAKLIHSIKAGSLQAKLDLANGVLIAYQKEPRASLIEDVMESASKIELESKAALLRLKLISANVLVKDANPQQNTHHSLIHEALMSKLK